MSDTAYFDAVVGQSEYSQVARDEQAQAFHDAAYVYDRPTGQLSNLDDYWNTAIIDYGVGQLISEARFNYIAGDTLAEPTEGYNAFRDSDLSGYEQHFEEFLSSESETDTESIKMLIDNNTKARLDLDRNNAGWTRFLGNMINPVNLIALPVSGGLSVAGGAIRGASVVGGAVAIEEIVRHNIDPTSTTEETVMNIAGGVVIGGALGGLVGGITSRQLGKASDRIFVEQQSGIEAAARIDAEVPNASMGVRSVRDPEVVVGDYDKPIIYKESSETGSQIDQIQINEAKLQDAFVVVNEQFPGRFKDYEDFKAFSIRREKLIAHVIQGSDETVDAFSARLDDAAYNVNKYEDYMSLARAYNPERLMPTGTKIEQLRWKEMPWLLLKNNKIPGFAGTELARLAEEFGGGLGLMTKGNREGVTTSAQSIYSAAAQHNIHLTEVDTGLWNSFLKSQGVTPDPNTSGGFSRTTQVIGSAFNGKLKKYREYNDEVVRTYLGGGEAANEHIASGVKALKKYFDYMGDQAVAAGAFRKIDLNKKKEWATILLERFDRYQAAYSDLTSKHQLSNKALEYKNSLEQKILPDLETKIRQVNEELIELEAMAKSEKPPIPDPISSGHFKRIWIKEVVEANREVLERIIADWYEGAGKATRAEDTVDNILKFGKLGRVARALEESLVKLDVPEHTIKRISKEIKDIHKKKDVRGQPLTDAGKMYEARIIVERVNNEFGLDEMSKLVKDTMDDIIAESRSPHKGNEAMSFSTTSLLSRKLDIPSHLLIDIPELGGRGFIETDIQAVTKSYHRGMSMAIEAARRYGDPSMQSRLDDIAEQIDVEIDLAISNKDYDLAKTLSDEKEIQMGAATELRDRSLGTFGMPNDPSSIGNRSIDFTKNMMTMAMMGKPLIAAFADTGKIAVAVGFKKALGGAFTRFTTDAAEFKKAGFEVEKAGEVSEFVLHTQYDAMTNNSTGYHSGGTRVEAAAQKGANAMFYLNGLSVWTDIMKKYAGSWIQSDMIEAILKENGKLGVTPSQRELDTLRRLGVSPEMSKSIAEEWNASGAIGPGNGTNKLYLANTDKWADEGARRVFRSALGEEVRNAVVTPGSADKLSFMSKPLGSMITQFKTFGVSSTWRTTMAGLQQRDARVFHGVASMVAMGYMIDMIRSSAFDDRPLLSIDRLLSAVEYSGATGILFDLNNIVENVSGAAGMPIGIRPGLGIDPRFGDPNLATAVGAVGGPAINLTANLIDALIDSDKSVVKAGSRFVPLNQLLWWSNVTQRMTSGLSEIIEE